MIRMIQMVGRWCHRGGPSFGILFISVHFQGMPFFPASSVPSLLMSCQQRRPSGLPICRGQGISQMGQTNFSTARILDYRRDEMLVEKAVGLTGVCTYKEAYNLVKEGRVTVDGVPTVVGQIVNKRQVLALDGTTMPSRLPIKYYLLNKPRGVMCTCGTGEGASAGEKRKEHEGGTVLDFVPPCPPVVPCGRLDYESEGLIILTNDGSLVHCVTSPKYSLPKTYQVLVRSFKHRTKPACPTLDQLASLTFLEGGIVLQNGVRLFCDSASVVHHFEGDSVVKITLTQGRNREVRKLMKGIGFRVMSLVRTEIGGITGPVSQSTSLLSFRGGSEEEDRGLSFRGGSEEEDIRFEPKWLKAAAIRRDAILERVASQNDVGGDNAATACAGAPDEERGRGSHVRRLVKRGEILRPGDACELCDDEVSHLFQLCKHVSEPTSSSSSSSPSSSS